MSLVQIAKRLSGIFVMCFVTDGTHMKAFFGEKRKTG